MKKLIALVALTLSTFTFAESCYQSETLIPRSFNIPEEICVSDFGLKLVVPTNNTIPYFEASAQTTLGRLENKITFFESRTAPFVIKVSGIIFEKDESSCSSYEQSKLFVEFEVDSEGKPLKKNLKVKVVHGSTNDSCHSQMQYTEIKYNRI